MVFLMVSQVRCDSSMKFLEGGECPTPEGESQIKTCSLSPTNIVNAKCTIQEL